MKKVFLGFLAILTFLLVALSSCSSKDNEENTDPEPPQKFENDILTVFPDNQANIHGEVTIAGNSDQLLVCRGYFGGYVRAYNIEGREITKNLDFKLENQDLSSVYKVVALNDKDLVVDTWDKRKFFENNNWNWKSIPYESNLPNIIQNSPNTNLRIFGKHEALDGNFFVEGLPKHYITSLEEGVVIINEKIAGKWKFKEYIQAPDGNSQDYFGSYVAIKGKSLLIGAPGRDKNGEDAGAAYYYELDNNTWILKKTLFGATGNRSFGTSVAIGSDYLYVGSSGNAPSVKVYDKVTFSPIYSRTDTDNFNFADYMTCFNDFLCVKDDERLNVYKTNSDLSRIVRYLPTKYQYDNSGYAFGDQVAVFPNMVITSGSNGGKCFIYYK